MRRENQVSWDTEALLSLHVHVGRFAISVLELQSEIDSISF